MSASFFQFVVFAEAAAPEGQFDPYFLPRLLFMAVPLAMLFYLMIWRPQKQKEQQLRDQVGSLKENDRVVTIGGIYGVVTNVQRDAQRVTVRVDESTGTKLRLNMTAIARVLTAEEDNGTSANKTT